MEYVARDSYDAAIVRVFASDEEEAKDRIRQELQKRGRERYLEQWAGAGEKVTVAQLFLVESKCVDDPDSYQQIVLTRDQLIADNPWIEGLLPRPGDVFVLEFTADLVWQKITSS